MSVVQPLQSPYLGKRFLEDDETASGRLPLSELKRARQQAAVIAEVLTEYGNNIDAAIKHLNELRISNARGDQRGDAGTRAAGAAAQQQQQQQQQPELAPEQPRPATAGPQPAGTEEAGGAAATAAGRSAEEWVELVVQQMAEATSVDNAKQRAASILQAFEQAAVQHAKQQAGDEHERLKHQAQEIAKENQLLKRAVAIQNARMQELSGREQEVQQLRAALEGYQQRVHALEVQNYSLALHLKQATDSRDPMRSNHNPDVF